MLCAVICTEARAEKVKKAVSSAEYAIVFEHTVPQGSGNAAQILNTAARVTTDILVLDLDVAPEVEIIEALHGYRMLRPTTRIILLAPGRSPGDATVAALVNMGIYDIVAALPQADWELLVRQALTGPPATYTQAAKWKTDLGLGHIASKAAEERPGGAITLSVLGLSHKHENPFILYGITAFLACRNYKVALVDVSQRLFPAHLFNLQNRELANLEVVLPGLRLLETAPPFYVTEEQFSQKIASGGYDYAIYYMGFWDEDRHREAIACCLPILTVNSEAWAEADIVMVRALGGLYRLALTHSYWRAQPTELAATIQQVCPVYVISESGILTPQEQLESLLSPILPASSRVVVTPEKWFGFSNREAKS